MILILERSFHALQTTYGLLLESTGILSVAIYSTFIFSGRFSTIICEPDLIASQFSFYRGKTAKEISVQILEIELPEGQSPVCTHLEHANYLGREFQRAEFALMSGQDYIQD